MRAVVLVPWRPGNAERERLYTTVRPYLERLGLPIFEGDAPGPWARGRAVNAAARLAGHWEAAVVADADTIPDPVPVRRAISEAVRRGAAIRPHDRLYQLTLAQTRVVVRRGLDALRLNGRQRTNLGGGLLVVSREAWDAVGGYDETNFVGWGHEDSDINTRLLAFADWDRVPGEAWHLFHVRERRAREENRDRMVYIQRQHRRRIEEVSRARGYDVGAIL